MPGRLRVFFVAASAAITAACVEPTEPIPDAVPQFLVHAVLDLGTADQSVLVERTQRNTQEGYTVRRATVTVTTPSGNVFIAAEDSSFSAFRPTVYQFNSVQQASGLIPGATYALRIETPAGDTITGTTTVPNAPPAQSPQTVLRFNRATDTLRLDWPRVPGARSYQVSLYSEQTAPQGFPSYYSVFADTTITIAGTARTFDSDPVFRRGTRARVVVAAVDDNYYTYFHAAVDPFAGAPPSRLIGALGVFGSAVPLIVRLYDVR